MIDVYTLKTEEHTVREQVGHRGPFAGRAPQDIVAWIDGLDLRDTDQMRVFFKAIAEELYWHRQMIQRLMGPD